MEKNSIIERATLLGNKIRIRRATINKQALPLYNNLISSTIQYLQQVRFFINNNNIKEAESFLLKAEKEYSCHIY